MQHKQHPENRKDTGLPKERRHPETKVQTSNQPNTTNQHRNNPEKHGYPIQTNFNQMPKSPQHNHNVCWKVQSNRNNQRHML